MREEAIAEGAIAQLGILMPDASIRRQRELWNASQAFVPDFVVRVNWESLQFNIVGEVYRSGSSASLRDLIEQARLIRDSLPDSVALIAAPYLSREKRAAVRDSDIGYVDLSGNAYLRYRSLLIMVEGARNRYNRESGSRSSFSGKASLVSEVLLEEPRLWGIRELALEADLDPGHVSRAVAHLSEAHYAVRESDGKVRVERPEDFIADWAAAYKAPRSEELMYFCQAQSSNQILARLRGLSGGHSQCYALGGPAGAFVVAPYAAIDRVDAYIGDSAAREWIEEGLELRRVERGANVLLKVLADPDDAVMRRRRFIDGLWVVSDSRLYLDLRRYPRRGIEQAEHLLEHILRPRWEGR